MNYYNELQKIEFYQKRPSYIPFVGEKYDEYKILHVGESHYIGQEYNETENDRYDIDYFYDKWWKNDTYEMDREFNGWYCTRTVIKNYMGGYRKKGHLIFTNFLKSFSKIVLKEDIKSINPEESKKYEYIAFMNFFQMPSLYKGMKFWNSILKSATKKGKKELAYEVWNDAVINSSEVLDEVLKVLKPRLVVFTSASAFDAYKKYLDSKNMSLNEKIIFKVDHPGCSWWNKVKKNQTKTSKELFEEILANIYNI